MFAIIQSVLFYISIAVFIISEYVGARMLPRIRSRGLKQTAAAKRGSLGLISISIIAIILLILAFQKLGLANIPQWLFYTGFLIILFGIAIRQWAIVVLGRFFNVNVRSVEGHFVIKRGPYRLVRHPSYTGLLIIILGIAIEGGSWEGVLCAAAISLFFIWYRIRIEESFLIEQLGNEYVEYRKHTKYLIPFLI
jgi:protein-S-isoprenylcysteine O-methyltransferase Ste14